MVQLTNARVDERHARSEEEKRKVLDYLTQTFPGVRGRVTDLCKVKQRTHELAITVVLEGTMDSIVVEREETARRYKEFSHVQNCSYFQQMIKFELIASLFLRYFFVCNRCIEYLRSGRHKPLNFLPLDTIKASAPQERLRMIPGAKLALDLIDYDKRDEKVMWFVTGDAIVVNNLSDAKRLAFGSAPPRCKIVTLDANIISRTGAMTGGDTSHLTNKAQRWQHQEFDRLKEKAEVTLLPIPIPETSGSQSDLLFGLTGKYSRTDCVEKQD